MPSISYSSSAKAAPRPEAGRAIGLVIVAPGSSGDDSHFDSRKSRLSDVAVQRRADRGGGSAWTVKAEVPAAEFLNDQEIFGIGRPVAEWRKNAPRPFKAQSRFTSRPWPALGISITCFSPLR